MKWIKKGLIFKPENQINWMFSHAQRPTAIVLNDRIRIFFSARLENQQPIMTFLDVEKNNPQKIISINKKPVLEPGRKGTFDENGILPGCFLEKDNCLYLYYTGWSRSKNVPYKNFTGLAISKNDGISFEKYSEAPVFTLNKFDPLSAMGPYIIHNDNQYLAIYTSGKNWIEIDGRLEHTYLLTYATSENAVDWFPSGKIIIQPDDEFQSLCNPSIIEINGIYHLWFSYRGSHNFRNPGNTSYRIGYAYSTDLINWTRNDSEAGINVSAEGWDSEMICYSFIVKVDTKYLMFYNGNGFGKSGFGYAELSEFQ
jgi:predicted GH43/DUF377 family glycosyl hydrolase